MSSGKIYADPETYEKKLVKVMARLGVEVYNYDWSRFESWITFVYKGQHYRFSHSVENAKSHGLNMRYGFALTENYNKRLADIENATLGNL